MTADRTETISSMLLFDEIAIVTLDKPSHDLFKVEAIVFEFINKIFRCHLLLFKPNENNKALAQPAKMENKPRLLPVALIKVLCCFL